MINSNYTLLCILWSVFVSETKKTVDENLSGAIDDSTVTGDSESKEDGVEQKQKTINFDFIEWNITSLIPVDKSPHLIISIQCQHKLLNQSYLYKYNMDENKTEEIVYSNPNESITAISVSPNKNIIFLTTSSCHVQIVQSEDFQVCTTQEYWCMMSSINSDTMHRFYKLSKHTTVCVTQSFQH